MPHEVDRYSVENVTFCREYEYLIPMDMFHAKHMPVMLTNGSYMPWPANSDEIQARLNTVFAKFRGTKE